MQFFFLQLQKLLLLPELGDVITDTDCDSVKTTNRLCCPNPLKLVNGEIATDSGHGSSTNGFTPRVAVNRLTASWTSVS